MKKRVHAEILKDMQKYMKEFDRKLYKKVYEGSDPLAIKYVREYYDNHLPVDVTAWMRVNDPDENLKYAKGFGEQVCFVRDYLCELLNSNYEEMYENPPMVIGIHYSKSVKLPVYQINLEKYGIEIVLRYNFYDWKISIKSDKPLNFDYMGLFNPTEEIESHYCQGFPEDKVYGSYEQNHSQFTIEIESYYDLYTFIFLLKNYLGIKKED